MLILVGFIAAAQQNQLQLNAEQARGSRKTQQSQQDPRLGEWGLRSLQPHFTCLPKFWISGNCLGKTVFVLK